MMETKDLNSYYPGYDNYCKPKEKIDPNDNPAIDERIDEMILKRLEGKESD